MLLCLRWTGLLLWNCYQLADQMIKSYDELIRVYLCDALSCTFSVSELFYFVEREISSQLNMIAESYVSRQSRLRSGVTIDCRIFTFKFEFMIVFRRFASILSFSRFKRIFSIYLPINWSIRLNQFRFFFCSQRHYILYFFF